MRVALVHEPLFNMGGSERVLLALHALFPQAPVYSAIYPRRHLDPGFRTMDIRTSFMQRLPLVHRQHRTYLPLYPFAYERMDLREYDVVISSSWSFAKGIVTRPDTLHICYCHNTMRVAWQYEDSAEREQLGVLPRMALPWFLLWLRSWDYTTASRVDHFVANSPAVAARIAKFYRRSAVVIPPPIDTARYFLTSERDDAFLIVSRLVPYKRLDVAVRAFTMLGLPLHIIGAGREEQRLKRIAGKNVRFLGRLTDAEVRQHLARCRALIFPGEEDFGLTLVEAQASGRPIIAYGSGGALASVVEGTTGTFFWEQTPEALAEAVRSFRDERFDPMVIRRHAETFDTQVFVQEFSTFVEARLAEHRERLRGYGAAYRREAGPPDGHRLMDGAPTEGMESVATDILPGVPPTRRPQ
jgi:glycosyltransferase involved in cell wall biosynthesis